MCGARAFPPETSEVVAVEIGFVRSAAPEIRRTIGVGPRNDHNGHALQKLPGFRLGEISRQREHGFATRRLIPCCCPTNQRKGTPRETRLGEGGRPSAVKSSTDMARPCGERRDGQHLHLRIAGLQCLEEHRHSASDVEP